MLGLLELQQIANGITGRSKVHHLQLAFEDLSQEESETLYQLVQPNFEYIIMNEDDLNLVIKYLYPKQCHSIFMLRQMKNLVKNAEDFYNVLYSLSPEQISAVYHATQDLIPTFMVNATSIGWILDPLSPAERLEVYNLYKKEILASIKSAHDFNLVSQYLPEKERFEMYNTLKQDMPTFIKNATDLGLVLEHLSPDHFSAVCADLKSHAFFNVSNLSYSFFHAKTDDKQPTSNKFDFLWPNP